MVTEAVKQLFKNLFKIKEQARLQPARFEARKRGQTGRLTRLWRKKKCGKIAAPACAGRQA
jgi:hypothetical protein